MTVLEGLPDLAAMTAFLPVISPSTMSLVNHVMLLAALYIGIVAGTKRLLAVQAITDSEGGDGGSSVAGSKNPSSLLSRGTLRAMIPHVVFALAYAVIFAAYQLSNKTTWVDIVPSLFIFVFLLMSFDAALGVLFSSTSFVCLSPRGLQEGQRQLVFFARRGRYAAWPYLSALLAGSIMLAASAECDAFFPLMGCAVLIMMGQGWFLPGSTWRLKNVVRYSSMYAALLWLLIGGAVCFDALTKNQPKGVTAQRHTNGTVTASSLPDDHVPTDPFAWVKLPSPWILRLLKYYISTSVIMGPLTLLSLNFRYDRSRAQSSPRPTASNGACDLPKHLGSFRKPTFCAGFTALTAVLLWFDYVISSPCVPRDYIWPAQTGLVIISIPAVLVASAVTAWTRGELKEWWAYEETWGPSGSEALHVRDGRLGLDEKPAVEA